MAELPDLHKQQAKAVGQPARTSQGSLATPPQPAHCTGLAVLPTALLTGADAPDHTPVTVAISRMCSTSATWNNAGPAALSHFHRAVPKATPVRLFSWPATNPFSEASLRGCHDNLPSLWPPRSPSATTALAFPPTTPPSTEIRGLPHDLHLPPAPPHTNSCHRPPAAAH